MACIGAPLWEILEAGQWRSPAFLKYLDLHSLDKKMVIQAHVAESDGDEPDDINGHDRLLM